MIGVRHGVDALPIADGLAIGAHAHAVLARCIRWADDVAPAAVRRIVRRVDTLRSARSPKAGTEATDTRISWGAGLGAPAAIQGICLGIDANTATRRRSAGTNALTIHACGYARTCVVTHAAMHVVRIRIDAIGSACILWWAYTCAALT